jgi:CRP-like cAMP-binding protein
MNRQTELLSKLFMFKQISPNDLSELCAVATPVSFGNGDIVYRQGEPAAGALFIVSGRLVAYMEGDGKDRTLGDARPGEIVGETGIFSKGSTRTASVKATEPTTCLVIDRALLEQTSNNPAIIAIETYLLSSIARRIRKTSQTIQLFWKEMEKTSENNTSKQVSFREKLNRFFGGGK